MILKYTYSPVTIYPPTQFLYPTVQPLQHLEPLAVLSFFEVGTSETQIQDLPRTSILRETPKFLTTKVRKQCQHIPKLYGILVMRYQT